jgi:hypothetical protein
MNRSRNTALAALAVTLLAPTSALAVWSDGEVGGRQSHETRCHTLDAAEAASEPLSRFRDVATLPFSDGTFGAAREFDVNVSVDGVVHADTSGCSAAPGVFDHGPVELLLAVVFVVGTMRRRHRS